MSAFLQTSSDSKIKTKQTVSLVTIIVNIMLNRPERWDTVNSIAVYVPDKKEKEKNSSATNNSAFEEDYETSTIIHWS